MELTELLSTGVDKDNPFIGIVTEAVGGACTVHTRSGGSLRCRPRGRLRQDGLRILPGDVVRYLPLSEQEGVIEEILPRRSLLQRPYVANVDQVVIVFSLDEPKPNLDQLDRMLVAVLDQGQQPLIVWNKADLVTDEERAYYQQLYEQAGFASVVTSTKANIGRDELVDGLGGHLTVLAGPSGVGKSSLLNWLFNEERFATGAVSAKLGRGRHTTRSVKLVPMPRGGWIADSPGFSVLDLSNLPKERLPLLYPDMAIYQGGCRFTGCLHRGEPGCEVQAAVKAGRIDSGRYARYLRLLEALEEAEKQRYQ